MKFKLFFILLALSVFGLPAVAQTPDGETPANEGVCDTLIGQTPGLYGLCVGFCEAQDCEATFDPGSGEVTFDACKPSSPKLLKNYNKKMQPGDPPMPCVNVTEGECPCWTELELDMVADGNTTQCDVVSAGSSTSANIRGQDAMTGGGEQATAQTNPNGTICIRTERTPSFTFQFLLITPDEFQTCLTSIEDECTSRGF